jgi:hypothetical protein
MILKSEIRPEILAQGCAKCGGAILEEEDCVLTFFKGSFIVLHEDCADFMRHATPGPRIKPSAPALPPLTIVF